MQPGSRNNDYAIKRKTLKMQVRSSPRKTRTKEKAALKTKKSRTEYPSTNVSSPVKAPKQKIRQFLYNQDDDEDVEAFEAPRHPTRKQQKARSYEDDGFLVEDDDVDEDFAPVRVARPKKPTGVKGLGRPITTDERVSELNDMQQCTFIDFMAGARTLRRDIMAQKGHREPIFNDTVLREMGLELPVDSHEMLALPGIRADMVERYGRRFLALVKNSRNLYKGEVPERRNLPPVPRDAHEEDDDEVLDPNHQNIIDLCSDDETVPYVEDFDSDYVGSDDDAPDEGDDDELHTSHHFTQHVDPEVAAFNQRMSQLGPMVPSISTKTVSSSTIRGNPRGPGAKKGRSFRRTGSGTFGKPAGVKKRAAKRPAGRASGGTSIANRTAGTGRKGAGAGGVSFSGGSIMAMPT